MYKILRVNIQDVFLFCRCYGSQRNQPNHYETLCIQNDSSQKEIREAFLKLSKQLHPDMGRKGSHAEFIKINEAYKILSKDYTRYQHDMDLKYRSGSGQRREHYQYADRVVYHYPAYRRPTMSKAEFDQDYYGIKGIKRVSNWRVAVLCVVVCVFAVGLQILALRRSLERTQAFYKSRSLRNELEYEKIRETANTTTKEEQLEALHNKYFTGYTKISSDANKR